MAEMLEEKPVNQTKTKDSHQISGLNLNPSQLEEKIEKMYHRVDKMKSMGVLSKEKEIVEHEIQQKKAKGEDYEYLEAKLELIDVEITGLQNKIEAEIITVDTYKTFLQKEILYEKQLLNMLVQDKMITNKQPVQNRIQQRIDIIQGELSENVEESKSQSQPQSQPQPEPPSQQNEKIKSEESKPVTQAVPTEEVKKEEMIHIVSNDELSNKLKTMLDDYRRAIDYFLQHHCTEQAREAQLKAKEIASALLNLKKGKEVEEMSLPLPVTPDFICGCNKKERLEKFAKMIKYYTDLKATAEQNLKTNKQKFQGISQKEFTKRKDEITEILDNLQNEVAKFKKRIDKLKEIAKDPWTPAPLFEMNEVEEKTEKVNEDIAVNTLMLSVGELNFNRTDVYIELKFQYSNDESKVINEILNSNGDNKFIYENPIKFDKYELKNLMKRKIAFNLFKKGWCCFKAKLLGELMIKLTDLGNKSKIEDNFEFQAIDESLSNSIKAGLLKPSIHVMMKLRNPVLDKEYDIKVKHEMEITKKFPSFNPKEDEEEVQGIPEKEPEPVPKQKKEVKVIEKKQQASVPAQEPGKGVPCSKIVAPPTDINPKPQKEKKPQEKIDPSEFSQEEISNPDILENLNSIKVLQFKYQQLDEQMKKIEGRTPRELRDRYLKMKVKCNTLENEISNGNINIQQYIALLKNQLDKDRRLMMYFSQSGQKEKAKLVSDRIGILIKEMDEALKVPQ